MGSLSDKAFDQMREKERKQQEEEREKQRKVLVRASTEEIKAMSYDDLVFLRRLMANKNNVKNFFTTMHHLSRNLG